MTAKKALPYGEAVAKAREMIAAARLADPDEHFPYKITAVRELLAENPPMGPEGPDDARVQAEDYMTQEIAEASAAYVDAQAAYLADGSEAKKAAYRETTDALVAARQAHRVNRPPEGMVVGIRSPRAGE